MKQSSVNPAGLSTFIQVVEKVKSEYKRTLTKRLLMIDALLVYAVLTNVVQVYSVST